MKKAVVAALVMYLGSVPSAQEPRTWSGVLSESQCGASHQAMAASMGISERECAFHCLKGLSKYVIVDEQKNVIPIANQDFAGMPLRLARPVRVTGVLTDNGIVISRIEPPLVHAHIGHVMIAWRDTPGQVGLLTIAQNDTRVAAAHALLLSKATSVDDMKLHAGHVLHALDPTIEKTGPASGYGAKKAASGAMQHVGFTAAVDNASAAVKSQASKVTTTADRCNGGDGPRHRGGAEDTRNQRGTRWSRRRSRSSVSNRRHYTGPAGVGPGNEADDEVGRPLRKWKVESRK